MQKKDDSIEVFQDLFLVFPDERRQEICGALRQHAKAPWRYAEEKARLLDGNTGEYEKWMVFEREPGDDIAASGLALLAKPDGYEVANIVPLELDELGVSGYNDVLNDFVDRIARPALEECEFNVKITKRRQFITDWISQEAAEALHRFSVLANKSTGSSHPSDRRRWFQFIMTVHKDQRKLDTDLLIRWLVEVEDWNAERAHKLAIEYEFGLALLNEYAGFH